MHLAGPNIAKLHCPIDDSRAAELVDNRDRHADADHAFAWAHQPHVKPWHLQRFK
jgi:hypothetical protein